MPVKKTIKKLLLRRETVRTLGPEIATIRGGLITDPGTQIASCICQTAVTEMCGYTGACPTATCQCGSLGTMCYSEQRGQCTVA